MPKSYYVKEVGPFICQYCGKEYTTAKGLAYHRNRCPSNPDRITNTVSPEARAKISQSMKTYSAEHKDERSQRSKDNWANYTPEERNDIRAKQKQAWTAEKKAEHKQRFTALYADNPELRARVGQGVREVLNSPEGKDKLSTAQRARYATLYADADKAKEYFRNKAISTADTRKKLKKEGLDSKWEKSFVTFLDSINMPYERNVPIEYTDSKGQKHITLVDFQVDGLLYEIKGPHLIAGVHSTPDRDIQDKLNAYRQNHVILITADTPTVRNTIGKPNSTESNGFKYLHKCPYPLIGLDIELFSNPSFPYRSDRPRCFYDVRVDNKPSAKEAWDNPLTRWKMIQNRIQYSGGFITSTDILTAMNITRTSKQPSWFSKEYAKHIINAYITTDTIIDGFAGYGMRHDAAIELNKHYIGIDFNQPLVDWHTQHNRNITHNDATAWAIPVNTPHSIFICPPYTDYEIYFDGQNTTMTQEDWLDVMIQNYPNASEYIMVCKIVDRYTNYIVETKANKGVIGKNVEKVIVIPGQNPIK